MTDLLTIYDVLTLPAGAQLVSDHGAVALLLVTRESADKVTIERVPLGQAVSLLDAIQAAQQRGIELFTPSVSVIAQRPAEAAPKALADSQPKRSGKALARQLRASARVTCPECGTAWKNAAGLSIHRARKHGVRGKVRAQRGLTTVSAPVAPIAPIEVITPDDLEPAACPACDKTFPTRRQMRAHKSLAHRAIDGVPVVLPPLATPDPEPAVPAAPDADVPYSDLEIELALASAPEVLRCELCFDPTPAHLVVNGRKLCAACAARNPAPRWDGKVAIA